MQEEVQKKRKLNKGDSESTVEVVQPATKKKKCSAEETSPISKSYKKVAKPKAVKPKVALDPLTKKFLQNEKESGQLKLHVSPTESMEGSAEAPGTDGQPLVERSLSEKSVGEGRLTEGNGLAEYIPAEETSTRVARNDTTETGISAKQTIGEIKKSVENSKSAEDSSAEESADSSSDEIDKEAKEITVAIVEKKDGRWYRRDCSS